MKPPLTPAETALVDAFNQRLSYLPGDAATALQRDKAIETVKAGLPTRRVESWHYTDLRRLLTSVPGFDASRDARPVEALLPRTLVLPVLNGIARARYPTLEGVSVRRL